MSILDKWATRRISKRGLTFQRQGQNISFVEWSKNFISTSNTPIQEVIFERIAEEFAKIDLFAYDEIVNEEGKIIYDELKHNRLNQLLMLRPNELLSAYEWKYTVAYQLSKFGNSLTEIIWKNKETYEIDQLFPLDLERYSFGNGYQLKNGRILLKLRDNTTGDILLKPYEDLIHIRANPNNVFGGDKALNTNVVHSLVKLFDTNLNATLNELVDSGEIRGVLKLGSSSSASLDNSLVGNQEKTKKQEEIVERIVKADGGILVIDSGEDFKPLASPFKTMSRDQMEEWMKYIYAFSGVNEAVVSGTANEDQMEVFFSKSISKLIDPFIEEMNYKVLSQNIRTRGRCIDYRRNPFEYISVTKAMDAAYKGLSITTQNEMRKMIFKFAPKEGGDILLNNLNFKKEGAEKGDENGENS